MDSDIMRKPFLEMSQKRLGVLARTKASALASKGDRWNAGLNVRSIRK